MSLRAPLAVVVEIRVDERRWFRLSRNVGEDGLTLQRPLPIEVGRPVELRLKLPLAPGPAGSGATPGTGGASGGREEDDATVVLRAELSLDDDDEPHGHTGGRALVFLDPPRERRALIARYVKERLALHLS